MSWGHIESVQAIGRVDGSFQGYGKLAPGLILDLPSRVGADGLEIRDLEQVVACHSEERAPLALRSHFIALLRPSS